MNMTETIDLLAGITDSYQSVTFSEKAHETWYAALSRYPVEAVRSAFAMLARQNPQFCPSLPSLVLVLDQAAHPDRLPPADAFERVKKAGLRCSAMDSTCARRHIDNELIWSAVRAIGGWEVFALTPYSDYPALRARFADAYETAKRDVALDPLFDQIQASLGFGSAGGELGDGK